ncbi:MAG: hypothetical protein JW967_01585 [Dehalococcoidales bacterium]|nr:hypothetical protein [Dehalococcoidales bacterium]
MKNGEMVNEVLLFDIDRDGKPAMGKWTPLVADESVLRQPAKPKIKPAKRYQCKLSVTKRCFICKKPFKAKREDAECCSPRCRMAKMRNRSENSTPKTPEIRA